MAYPKKVKEFRTIVVDNQPYRWRLTSALRNMGEANGASATLTLQGNISGRQQAIVVLPEWSDLWLLFPAVSRNEPSVVTPDFAQQAIRSALENGWTPDQKGSVLRIVYENKFFSRKMNET